MNIWLKVKILFWNSTLWERISFSGFVTEEPAAYSAGFRYGCLATYRILKRAGLIGRIMSGEKPPLFWSSGSVWTRTPASGPASTWSSPSWRRWRSESSSSSSPYWRRWISNSSSSSHHPHSSSSNTSYSEMIIHIRSSHHNVSLPPFLLTNFFCCHIPYMLFSKNLQWPTWSKINLVFVVLLLRIPKFYNFPCQSVEMIVPTNRKAAGWPLVGRI